MHGWVLPFQYFSCVLKPGWNCHHSNFAFNPDRWISTSMTKTRGGHMQGKILFPDCVRRGNRWPVKTKHAVSSCKKMLEFQCPLLTKQSNERQPFQFSESILTSASFSPESDVLKDNSSNFPRTRFCLSRGNGIFIPVDDVLQWCETMTLVSWMMMDHKKVEVTALEKDTALYRAPSWVGVT